jgi:hypothetical protein
MKKLLLALAFILLAFMLYAYADDVSSPSGGQQSLPKVVVVPTPMGDFQIPLEYVAVIILSMLAIVAGFAIYSSSSARKIAARVSKGVIKEKEVKEREERFLWLKDRKGKLKTKIGELEKKETRIGLNTKESATKKAYEEELVKIEDELFENDVFLAELDGRAWKALEEARKGVPSKNIIEELTDEGYTTKEIEVIKRLFQEKRAASIRTPSSESA